MHQNVALVKTTREAVGDNVDIMADAYMGWNLEHARRMLRMLAPYNMRWVEEPAISDDQFDVNRVGGITAAKKIVDVCEANDVLVIPHAGQMHNYHITMSSYAGPISEYFPKVPVEVGNELFWYILTASRSPRTASSI